MKRRELIIEASVEHLQQVLQFVDSRLEEGGCTLGEQMKIDLAVEEIFVNIASYAYGAGKGEASVDVEFSRETGEVTITFTDRGVPYNPLEKKDPNIKLSAAERQIGGLGIFIAKKSMDELIYEYKDGCNILHMKKKLKIKPA